MQKRALIIDGNSIINRAFFGIRNMATPDGFPTNALYGFLSIYQSVSAEIKPSYVAVAFDLKGPTFRHKTFEAYKAGRKGMPDELRMQMPVLKEILKAMGIEILELQGFEADDLLGTASKFLGEHGVHSYVLTGDKDALQLVDETTSVYYHGTKNKVIYNPMLVEEDMGVPPNRVIDLKGLMGDSSDNIPGIPKVGKVTANKLLEEFGTVENLIKNSSEIKNARIKGLVEEHAELAVLSKKLATIVREVPVEMDLSEFEIAEPNMTELVALFQKYSLHSFLQKLGVEHAQEISHVTEAEDAFSVAQTADEIDSFFKQININEELYLSILYDKVTLVNDEISYIGIARKDGEGILVHGDLVNDVVFALNSLALSGTIKLAGHDIKNEMLILRRYGINNIKPVFDAQIAMYLVDANRKSYELNDLTLDLLGKSMATQEDVLGKGVKKVTFKEADSEKALSFINEKLKAVKVIHEILLDRMQELELIKLFDEVEMPLVEVLVDMEYVGFNIKPEVLDVLDVELNELIANLQSEIYEAAGTEFNINSPKQLGVILFETLGLPPIKKTKTGYSTSHDVLVELITKHNIIEKIIDYRTYAKLKSTYIDGLRAVINPITGRIHSSLNQTVAATGRLSSTEPNLQNIPIRLEMGRELRKVFIASQGNVLVDADYSQIELRVLAHMSNDPMLKKAYTENIDIHALTASQVFETPLDEVTPDLRSRAKEVNFGIVYGMSDFGLSETLKITRKTAKEYIENYFAKYPNVKGYMNECKEFCSKTGYSETILGRKRFIPEIKNKNFNIRQYGERMAMNTPIQGSAADIIKLAMIKVYNALKESGLKSQLILQVHDELIIDTKKDEIEKVEALLEKCMLEAVELSVPLSIDMHTGDSWFDAK
ncbi:MULTISPECIES: DNA polymerase I [unclassified Fusibacter]|uniref:DNA polymerase I n=1 Tax=unclassified Fusibacter TaxID=2624464 RepID=UPI0010126D90|nr:MULTISPECIES: DNA polymerase I [unclassified Fusibacter]MCK8060611.1 DNA polymerase I [Fusibacter sp. A2]NPE22935.1 DNA polymerase I [Fusibacter sp. A1]RXV60002.1 DNA polymerase I [Fusibacter sp. A1]